MRNSRGRKRSRPAKRCHRKKRLKLPKKKRESPSGQSDPSLSSDYEGAENSAFHAFPTESFPKRWSAFSSRPVSRHGPILRNWAPKRANSYDVTLGGIQSNARRSTLVSLATHLPTAKTQNITDAILSVDANPVTKKRTFLRTLGAGRLAYAS